MLDLNKVDIRDLNKEARRIFEASDQEAIKDFFGSCTSISEVDAEAKALYEECKVEKVVEYTDPDTGATSSIDTINVAIWYQPEDYIDDCRNNSNPEYIEKLERGTISLVEVDD